MLVCTVVYFRRKLDALVPDYGTDARDAHHLAASCRKSCQPSIFAPTAFAAGCSFAAANITGINRRSPAGPENPFVTRTEQTKPTNEFCVLRLIEWQHLFFFQFLHATLVDDPADVERVGVVEIAPVNLASIYSSVRSLNMAHQIGNSRSTERLSRRIDAQMKLRLSTR